MRVYLLVAYLFVTATAVAQKHSIIINYKPSLTYFGKPTQTFKHYYFHSRQGNQTFNSAINVLYSYRVCPKVSLTTGIEYSQQGQNISFNADSAPSNKRKILKLELDYLRVPLTVDYSILKKSKAEWILYTGVSFGIAIKRRDNYQWIILEDILLPEAEKRYKKYDWAIPIGTKYERQLSSKISANIGFEYLLGLTSAFAEDVNSKFGVLSEFNNSRQTRLSFNIGVRLNLTKY